MSLGSSDARLRRRLGERRRNEEVKKRKTLEHQKRMH